MTDTVHVDRSRWSDRTPVGRFDHEARGMQNGVVRVGTRALTVPSQCIQAMRERLLSVPLPERSDIAYRASAMIRQACVEGQLRSPLRSDFEDAIAMLLVLGIKAVHI